MAPPLATLCGKTVAKQCQRRHQLTKASAKRHLPGRCHLPGSLQLYPQDTQNSIQV